MTRIEALPLEQIRTDSGAQMRAELNADVLLDYRDKWETGYQFPPIDVFFDGSTYWLGGGFHRYWSAGDAGKEEIVCRITDGTQRDAVLFACGDNTDHGLRRTNADKKKAVMAMLNDKEWRKWSDRKISEHVSVSHTLVSQLRDSTGNIASTSSGEERVGRDGKSRRTRTPVPVGDDLYTDSSELFDKAIKGIYGIVGVIDKINLIEPDNNMRQAIQDSLQDAKNDLERWKNSIQ